MAPTSTVFHIESGDNVALLDAIHATIEPGPNKVEIHLAKDTRHSFKSSYRAPFPSDTSVGSDAHNALGTIPFGAHVEIFGNGAVLECNSNGRAGGLRFATVLGRLTISNAQLCGGMLAWVVGRSTEVRTLKSVTF
jgi:hypothetical protein